MSIELAREHDSEVVLVHVSSAPLQATSWYEPTKLLERYGEEASGELERFEIEASELYPNAAPTPPGVVYEVIGELVGKLTIDLIVMSIRGQTHLIDLLIGGTAEKLLRYAPCPILRIRTV